MDEFANRTYQLIMDTYPDGTSLMVQQLSMEHFLGGCRDKAAAYAAMEKFPKDVYKALKSVKSSMCNLKTIGRTTVQARQVCFEEEVTVRQINPSVPTTTLPSAPDTNELAKQIGESLANQLQKLVCNNVPPQRNRSPSPGGNTGC